jgi:two-component system chemotaxis response regulator CheY
MLVVDDFSTMTRVMKTLAQRIGFEDVDVCHDGGTALDMLRARDYGFVLCDLEMHPMSGAEFARRARGEPWGSRCVIVLTTASRESAARAVRDGMHLLVDGFILKPFNSEDLRAKLLEITDRRSGKSAAAQ